MRNPWIDFDKNISQKNLVLSEEKQIIKLFNERANEDHKIYTDIMPAPFMGDVLRSKIVLLTLNPGYDKKEKKCGFYTKYKDTWYNHIKSPNKPLFCFDKEYIKYSNYWVKKLKPLIEISNEKIVAKNISVIQFFPYHSLKYKNIPKRILDGYLKSQEYNFYLVKKAIERKAVIIIMRSEKLWFKAVPELEKLKKQNKVHRTNSPQNPTLSEINLPTAFNSIKKILT